MCTFDHNLCSCKNQCAVEKGKVCAKKCRDSGQNGDLCAGYQVLCSCESCLKYALLDNV